MSNPVAGWYPDPAGDQSKLRYWDGQAWTDRFMDKPPEDAAQSSDASNQQTTAAYATDANYQSQGAQGTQSNPYNVQVNIVDPVQKTYELSSDDRTLRLIAFIFAIISTVSAGFLILPLCWMIPMTVYCWKLYKGTRANTVAFGVCTLIFLSVVSGILLLVSTKEEQ